MHAILIIVFLALLFLLSGLVTLALGLLPFLLIFLIFGLGVALCVFWIWMLVDAIRNPGLSEGEKIGWVLAIVLLHPIAALLYFFIGRPRRNLHLAAAA